MSQMSPTPPTNAPDLAAAAEDFKRGGWIVSILGGAGVIARLLIEDDNHPLIFWIRRGVAGVIVGCLCYFALWGVDMQGIHKSIILCSAGAYSPEIMEQLRKRFNRGLEKDKAKQRRTKR